MTSVGRKMAKGVRWSALEKGGQQVITFIVFAILARFIAPEDFGLVAMALVIIGFIQLFIDQGFSTAIIQREVVDGEYLSTAFWSNCAIGIVLGVVLIGLKDVAAWFFNEPRVAELIPWMALALLFEALISVPQALLKRKFDFRGLALRTTMARLLAGAVAIYGAASGWGVWSLVVFTVLSGALSTAILWWISDWHPKFRFSAPCFRDLFHFGAHVTGVRIMSYVNSRVLDVLIGYFFGAVALGYYILAYQLVGRIGAVMVQVLSQVTISGFSRVQASPETLLKHMLGVTRLTTAIVFPLFALVGLMAEDLVYLLYGDGWEWSAMLISILAPIGPAMVMSSSLSNTVMSAGAPHLILRAMTLSTVLLVVALLSFRTFGVEVLILTFTVSFYVLTLPLYYLAARQVIPLRLGRYIIQQMPAVLATASLLVTVYYIQSWIATLISRPWEVIITMFVAGTVYLLVLSVMDRKIIVDLRRILLGAAS